MSAIGFRCFTDGFSFAVLEGSQQSPKCVAHQRLRFPKGLCRGAELAWLRKEIVELLERHDVSSANIKGVESVSQRKSPPRFEIEGVIKEAVYSSRGSDCISRVKSQLRRDISGFTRPARYLAEVLDSRTLGDLNSNTYSDAALAALAGLPKD